MKKNNIQQTFHKFDNIIFSSEFDSGNLLQVYQI